MTKPSEKTGLIGLDIGTTACKAIAYAPNGEALGQASVNYQLSHPQAGFAELNPEDVLAAVRYVLSAIAHSIEVYERLAMAISAQGEAFVLADRQGQALTSAPVSMDMRGAELIAALKADSAASEAEEDAGQDLTPLTSLAKLLWFRHAQNHVLERADKALCMGEFVMAQLGVRPVMDWSMASRMGLLNNRTRAWSHALLEASDLPASLFPPVAPSGTFVGTVPAETMETWGIGKPVDIYTGGHDQACALLGAAVSDTATALYSIGTTEAIAVPVEASWGGLGDKAVSTYPHVVANRSVILFGSQHGGRVLQWLARLLGETDPSAIVSDLPEAPSLLTFIPHFGSSGTVRNDGQASGTFHGLDYTTTRETVTLGVLEGITMEQAWGLATLRDQGLEIRTLRAVGGGSRSDQWMQLKADVLDLPIECLDQPDTACAGAAILAGRGANVLQDGDPAFERFATIRRRFQPRPDMRELYALKRDLYERLYQATANLRQEELNTRQTIERAFGAGKGT